MLPSTASKEHAHCTSVDSTSSESTTCAKANRFELRTRFAVYCLKAMSPVLVGRCHRTNSHNIIPGEFLIMTPLSSS